VRVVSLLPSLTAVLPIVACGTTVELPPAPERIPVVEGFLLADSSTSLFRIVWSQPLGRPVVDSTEPVAAPLVHLVLRGPAGASGTLAPVADSAGYHRVRLAIQRGALYRLEGTVDGVGLAAETTVPSRFDVAAPGDLTAVAAGSLERLPFRWSSSGAAAFFARGARFPFGAVSTRDTMGSLSPDVRPAGTDAPLLLFAISEEADGYLFGQPHPRTNLRGVAFGYLGSGIAIRRTVRWQ
jgi:hypothetical protein